MSLIIDTVQAYLPAKRKHTPSGWTSFNAVCCIHNGTTADTRQRGGIMITADSVSYHCFNCQFKASWQPGRPLTAKFKKLLSWLHVPDDLINKCTFEALKLKNESTTTKFGDLIPTFLDKALPRGAKPISEWINGTYPQKLIPVIEYIYNTRGYTLDDYNWHWTDELGFRDRLIIPFYYQNRIVGYTSRKITDGKPKYISEQQPGYVFNLDRQTYDRKFVIVCEGPIDAIAVDGIAIMGSDLAAGQKTMINRLQREVIVIPDRDQDGLKMVQQAIDNNWSVSFPEWDLGIKDINDAVKKYGKLYTLYSIVQSKVESELKIQLLAKKWFRENK